MCRIDAPFVSISLDEKSDPNERFIQALDESGIDGHARSLLTEHFSNNWNRIFGSATELEEALNSARQETSAQKRCAVILSSGRLAHKLAMHLLEENLVTSQRGKVADHRSEVVAFAQEVAQTLFSGSPYALYSALKNSGKNSSLTLPYNWFVTALYGEEFCFSRSLFDDPALIAKGELTRNDILWEFFNNTSQHDDGNQDELTGICEAPIKNLIAVAFLALNGGPPTFASHKFMQGIRFLNAWVAADAIAGRLRNPSEGAFHKLDFEWSVLESSVRSIGSSNRSSQEVAKAAIDWLEKSKVKLWETLCLNMTPNSEDHYQVEQWASLFNTCYTSLSIRHSGIMTQSPEERDAAENEYLKFVCAQLTDYQLEAWVQWSIRRDLESALRQSKRTHLGLEFYGHESKKWWASEYSVIWKAKLQEELIGLNIEDQLTVLSGPLRRLPNETAASKYLAWWDGLFERLIQDPNFPTALTPQWAIAAVDRLDSELVLPYIDKSIGLLRGQQSSGAQPNHHRQLVELLSKLSFFKPSKALRHRLMLMRSSVAPFTDESISPFNGVNSDNAIDWYKPLKDVARDRFAKRSNLKPPVSQAEFEQIELDCYESCALELVEFCLSRLRLRKGEKPEDGKYDASQVTEKSPIWRQGYLKALLELGLDPSGKAHKTVYFTKQFDPDESVRAIAKECYRAVRREATKNRGTQDFKRALIAAEWWLLISQRRELNLRVDYEEALKTRRSLLRNP